MKAQWVVLIVVGAVAILGLVVLPAFRRGPDLGSYLPLKEPRLSKRANERVLEVEFSGPADTVIPKAYSALFKAYFGLAGSPRGPAMKPPKARYEMKAVGGEAADRRLEALKAHPWTGSVAIPIPETLAVAERGPEASGMVARAATWEYGEVAEILHLGSYDTEPPTIKKLEDFIDSRGYRSVGDHEEEYLKGPGMPRVSPKDYWTIIRYRVEKVN